MLRALEVLLEVLLEVVLVRVLQVQVLRALEMLSPGLGMAGALALGIGARIPATLAGLAELLRPQVRRAAFVVPRTCVDTTTWSAPARLILVSASPCGSKRCRRGGCVAADPAILLSLGGGTKWARPPTADRRPLSFVLPVPTPMAAGHHHGSAAMRRLLGERRRLAAQPAGGGIEAGPGPDGDLFRWCATIEGPADTPWAGRSLGLDIVFPPEYPFRPPEVRFTTSLRHPNVYPDGSVCVDLLGPNWAPACDVRSVLMTLQLLLAQPNPDSPANISAANVYRADGMDGLRRLNEDDAPQRRRRP